MILWSCTSNYHEKIQIYVKYNECISTVLLEIRNNGKRNQLVSLIIWKRIFVSDQHFILFVLNWIIIKEFLFLTNNVSNHSIFSEFIQQGISNKI